MIKIYVKGGVVTDVEGTDDYEIIDLDDVIETNLQIKHCLHKDGTPVWDGFRNEAERDKTIAQPEKLGYKPIIV